MQYSPLIPQWGKSIQVFNYLDNLVCAPSESLAQSHTLLCCHAWAASKCGKKSHPASSVQYLRLVLDSRPSHVRSGHVPLGQGACRVTIMADASLLGWDGQVFLGVTVVLHSR